jgi:hypothetical protein
MSNKLTVIGLIKGIAKFFSYLLAVIAILVAAAYISDITREGTPFTSRVTTAEDAKLLDSHVWGFVDSTYRYHFTATPKTIDSIIKDKGLKPVMNEKLTQLDLPKNTDWNSPPGQISSYRYKRYGKSENEAHLGKEFLATIYILQHNQQKNEAFYLIDEY